VSTERPAGLRTGMWMFPDRPARELVQVIVHAERCGLDELWLGDEGPAREPFSVLAAAAGVTERIALGVGITNPYVRHPAVAASTMLTVHELSGGRAVLGVGAGGQMSLSPFGLQAADPVARVREFLETARAVSAGRPGPTYHPPDIAITEEAAGGPMPLYVGARGERLNRLASELADGAFVAGMPPYRFGQVVSWARAQRDVEVALYPSAALTDEAADHHRPEMIWSLRDAPAEVRAEMGVDDKAVQAAADALRRGDAGPARRVVDDRVLPRLMLLGGPTHVGRSLADLVRQHRPTSVGMAVMQDDLHGAVELAAAAFGVMRRELGSRP
jgi:5,10-methylenetetrahydromethanopterin reductase